MQEGSFITNELCESDDELWLEDGDHRFPVQPYHLLLLLPAHCFKVHQQQETAMLRTMWEGGLKRLKSESFSMEANNWERKAMK